MYMKKIKCSNCKRYYDRKYLIINSRQGKIIYLWCRSCARKRLKKYRQTKRGKLRTYLAVRKSIRKYSYKQNARQKLAYGIKRGFVIKPNKCKKCKKIKIVEGHHFDYKKPLKVIWLCRSCHSDIHSKKPIK